MFRHGGFSLIEVLVVMGMMAILYGTVALGGGLFSESSSVRATRAAWEAEALRRWLTGIFQESFAEDRSFQFVATGYFRDFVYVRWVDTNEKEYFRTGKRLWICPDNDRSLRSTVSASWQTVSPCFTLKLATQPDKKHLFKYLVVSLRGRVRLSDEPPPD